MLLRQIEMCFITSQKIRDSEFKISAREGSKRALEMASEAAQKRAA